MCYCLWGLILHHCARRPTQSLFENAIVSLIGRERAVYICTSSLSLLRARQCGFVDVAGGWVGWYRGPQVWGGDDQGTPILVLPVLISALYTSLLKCDPSFSRPLFTHACSRARVGSPSCSTVYLSGTPSCLSTSLLAYPSAFLTAIVQSLLPVCPRPSPPVYLAHVFLPYHSLVFSYLSFPFFPSILSFLLYHSLPSFQPVSFLPHLPCCFLFSSRLPIFIGAEDGPPTSTTLTRHSVLSLPPVFCGSTSVLSSTTTTTTCDRTAMVPSCNGGGGFLISNGSLFWTVSWHVHHKLWDVDKKRQFSLVSQFLHPTRLP